MSDDTTISIETLRQVLNQALDSLQEQTGNPVELDKDFFWSLPPEVQYDPYTPPSEGQFTLGQLSDAWNTLSRMHTNGDKIPTYALVWIGHILQALGHRAP